MVSGLRDRDDESARHESSAGMIQAVWMSCLCFYSEPIDQEKVFNCTGVGVAARVLEEAAGLLRVKRRFPVSGI